jgi:hypothetical protein
MEWIGKGYTREQAEEKCKRNPKQYEETLEAVRREQEKQLRWLMKGWKKEPKKKAAKITQSDSDQVPEIEIGTADLEWLEQRKTKDSGQN